MFFRPILLHQATSTLKRCPQCGLLQNRLMEFRMVRFRFRSSVVNKYSLPNKTVLLKQRVCWQFQQQQRFLGLSIVRFASNSRQKDLASKRPLGWFADLRRLIGYARPIRTRLALGVCLLCVSSAVSISVPFFLGRIMDIAVGPFASSTPLQKRTSADDESMLRSESGSGTETSNNKSGIKFGQDLVSNLQHYCAALLFVFALGATANFGRAYLMLTASQIITNRLRTSAFGSIIRQEIAFFDRHKTGELVNRLSNDATIVGHSISMNLSNGLRSLFAAVGSASMMVYVSPSLSLVGVVLIPFVAGMGILYGKYLQKLTTKMNDALAGATQIAEERISSIRTVRAFVGEQRERERYDTQIQRVLMIANKDALARAGFFGLMGFNGNVMMLSILYAGGHMITNGTLTVGSLTSFLAYAIYIVVSVEGLSGFYTELMRGLASGRLLFHLAERKPLIPLHVSGGRCLSSLEGNIQFSNVTFSYAHAAEQSKMLDEALESQDKDETKELKSETHPISTFQENILNDLCLTMRGGTTTALVGASGSGKSTVASLLLEFYQPTSGCIYVDGCNITELDTHWLKQQFGVVAQEPTLFSCSVRDNITYGAFDAARVTEEQIEWAVRQANAHSFIHTLAQGLDTIVGERGSTLSGGQRQRVAIARALINNPKVLIFDEATSALDAESEYQVRRALESLMKQHNRTVLVIAHRLSTIRNADQIAVLDQGRVAELGTFNQLVARRDGLFRQLMDKQQIDV